MKIIASVDSNANKKYRFTVIIINMRMILRVLSVTSRAILIKFVLGTTDAYYKILFYFYI